MLGGDFMETYNINGYEKLSAAVVEKAVRDYRFALKRLRRKPDDIGATKTKNDCERFFRDEIGIYCSLDGETIMRIIRDQVEGIA